ncbi:flagellar biosynthesis protein FlhG [Natranaerovirga hydrolytica]|uniref:Flagellar biosynthesis protein FlhG n=1 Tax=Natranaerovirga hydrolytica TaxID=680378 RepID=A0A4V2Q1J7_9FIRM|nr:MinD/ParA family protein [Natranaerovirga hydrolytica]TCK97911.1 flagellar biosynthesis protein FlhG [Natranaerovirga hydrolytica]
MDQAEQLRKKIKKKKSNGKSARLITVTSGKGGVGKTNVSVNLAVQLKKMGKRVMILDADFGLANIEVLFGIFPKQNLSDLIYKGKDIKDIITQGPLGIEFISGGSGIQELSQLRDDQIHYLMRKLQEIDYMADIIIIDTGAGISSSVLKFVMASEEVILVTTPEPTSITDSYSLLKALKRSEDFDPQKTSIKLITNKVHSKKEGENIFLKLKMVVKKFLNIDLTHLGIIPQDNNIEKAVIEQKPITIKYPNSGASKAIAEIASSLLEIENESMEEKSGMGKFISNFVNLKIFK